MNSVQKTLRTAYGANEKREQYTEIKNVQWPENSILAKSVENFSSTTSSPRPGLSLNTHFQVKLAT